MALGGAGQGGLREGGCLYWGGRGENNLELGGTLNLLGWLRGERAFISSPQRSSSDRSLQSAVVSHRGLGFFTQVPSSQRWVKGPQGTPVKMKGSWG